MTRKHAVPMGLGIVAALSVLIIPASAFAQSSGPAPTVSYPSGFAVSPPLSSIHESESAGPPELKIHARRPLPRHLAAQAGQQNASDRALQTAAGSRLAVRENPNFPGLGEAGAIPPDPNIAVGPNHIVQVVNSQIAVFTKGGSIYSGYPKSLSSLWSAMGGPCATNNAGDPVVQYDRAANRFVVTQLGSLNSPYSQCFAVSASGDPTGSYYLYSYSFGSNLNDYQKIGVWPTATTSAYLATYNLFANGNSFVGADLCAYDRGAMLSGAASAAFVCFTLSGDGGYLPSDLDGPTVPADGTPGYFLTFETLSSLRLYQLSPNFANPASSTLSAATDITVASFSEACGGGSCVPQPGTSRQLDSLGDRLMYRLAYRVFPDHQAMVVNHSVAAGTSVGVRWYELRRTSGAFSLYQQGTFAPDSSYRWMGSIAMDQVGDMALGYSTSSSTVYPSITYTGRVPSDPLGTMEAETVLQPGNGAQTGYSRWGDYTSMRLDPSDDCTFWYTDEYYPVTSSYVWYTAIGSFKFANCTGSADFTVAATAAPLSFTAGTGGTANGTVTVSSLNNFSSAVNLALSGCPPSATCTLGSASLTPPLNGSTSTSLKIVIAAATPAGSYPITVTGTSGSLTHSSSFTLTVAAPPADFTLSASPSSLTVKRGTSGKYTVSLGTVSGSSSVSLSVSGLPKRTNASFSPNPVTTPGSSTLTVSVNRPASTGTATLRITGNNGSFTHSTSVTLVIQ